MAPVPNPVSQPFPARSGRRWQSLRLLGMAVFFLLTLNLRAALQFDVFLGLDNYIPEASWFPIICEVNNDGPAFQGVIEVAGGGMGQGGYARLVPVELPTGTRKRVTIPLFCANSYNGEWDVRLKDEQGRTRAEQLSLRPRSIVKRSTVLLGSVSRTFSWTPSFQRVADNQTQWQPAAARFQPTLLPDNPIVLEGLDALYLSSERAADLRASQVAAIQSWINSGGHLIVAVDQISDVNSLAWLRALVPVELDGVQQVRPGTALEDWLRSPVKPSLAKYVPRTGGSHSGPSKKPDVTLETPFGDAQNDAAFDEAGLNLATGRVREGTPLVSVGTTPLIVTTTRGNGRITVLLFSPEREPVKSWRNQPAFWSRLAQVPPRWYASTESYYPSGWGVDGIFGAMIDSRQVRKLPIGWLLLMLLAYLAVIGPVDQIWLRKLGKPMLTWITFPCYVVLFSVLIYLVGYKLRAGESEWNELHVVDVFPAGNRTELRGHTFGSIYSPVNQRYEFAGAAKATAFRGEFSGNWNTQSESDRGRVVQSESSFKADLFVPVWTCQLYVNDWLQTADAPFFAALDKNGANWTIKVQNRLTKPLTHVRVVLDGFLYELGDVPAGQTREWSQATATGSTSLPDFVNRYGNGFQNAVQQRRAAFGGMESGRLNDLPNDSVAASFLGNLQAGQNYYTFICPPAFDLSGAAGQNNAIVLAWSAGESPIKPLNQFATRRKTVNTLWRETLPLPSTH